LVKSAEKLPTVNDNAFADGVGAKFVGCVVPDVIATGKVVLQGAPENTFTVEPAVSTVFDGDETTRGGRTTEAAQVDAAAVFVSLAQLAEMTASVVGTRDEVAERVEVGPVEHCPLPPMSLKTLPKHNEVRTKHERNILAILTVASPQLSTKSPIYTQNVEVQLLLSQLTRQILYPSKKAFTKRTKLIVA
jgi:hypothetical protein